MREERDFPVAIGRIRPGVEEGEGLPLALLAAIADRRAEGLPRHFAAQA